MQNTTFLLRRNKQVAGSNKEKLSFFSVGIKYNNLNEKWFECFVYFFLSGALLANGINIKKYSLWFISTDDHFYMLISTKHCK